ncbi:hypothetical protein JM83_3599 [Gillisia sp. Hel_I_86]|uniref:hypothetical protein n=1 Tax=Gillisia sp. Hel_I_86 TaxID=1249981 RepID=UPI00119A9C3B|nr:hypothetical protein [Gillisia sp. Hel_I_86]TVZ28468.1 hypothetical protein JM83_3599 [Gillisia sp. Hel_I_86]
MKNPKAQKLIDKIQHDLMRNGLIINTLVEDLKQLRPFAIEEEDPLLAKVIRLTYEHVKATNSFEIPIPEDEPLDENENEITAIESTPQESLDYLLSLMHDTSIKNNVIDLREYSNALTAYADEN